MILAEEKVEKNSLEMIKPELIGQAQQQQSIIRKIYKAVFRILQDKLQLRSLQDNEGSWRGNREDDLKR
jgi:hypothetical protein